MFDFAFFIFLAYILGFCTSEDGKFTELMSKIAQDNQIKNSCSRKNMKKKVYLYGNQYGHLPSSNSLCSETCSVTNNVNEADVVIWHVWTEETYKLKLDSPKTVIAFGIEPYHHINEFRKYDFVNFTSSYSYSSDILYIWSEGFFFDKIYSLPIPTEAEFNSLNSALFVASRCIIKKRTDFMRELMKHFPIQSRGACLTNAPKTKTKHWTQTDDEVFGKYKFYIAYDKTELFDYVSEKFQTGFIINAVPVYLGNPIAKFYAPKNSWIDIHDFKSIKELGDHLHVVANNYTKWREYFNYRTDESLKVPKNISEWVSYTKQSPKRDNGNLCRFCDYSCADMDLIKVNI